MKLSELRTGDTLKFLDTSGFEFGDTWAVIFSVGDEEEIDAYGTASRREARRCAQHHEWFDHQVTGRIARIVKATKAAVTVEVSK